MTSCFRASLLLVLMVGSASAASKNYVPLVDPHEPVPAGSQPVTWRGDTMHPRPAADSPDASTGIFHVEDLRWVFEPPSLATNNAWKPIFLSAGVDINKVSKLSMLWSPFFPDLVAGHTALLIEFEPGGITRRGADADRDLVPATATGLVLSIEARMKHGEKYGFLSGLKGEFPLVYSLSTWENYRQRCLDVYQGKLQRWDLLVNPVEAREVARAALKDALSNHRGETYWLTRRSCSTEFLDILIRGLEEAEDLGQAMDRGEHLKELQEVQDSTRAASLEEAAEEGQGYLSRIAAAGGSVVRRAHETAKWLNPIRRLGGTRDNVRRRTPHGIFVNPAMSLPARLPGVLERRGLVNDDNPDEKFEHDPANPVLRFPSPATPSFDDLR